MKRSVIFLGIIIALVVMTGCEKAIEKVNAVVYDFWTQWHAADEAKLASLMTDEVDFGTFLFEDSDEDHKALLPEKGVRIPAGDVADYMISVHSMSMYDDDAFEVTKTTIYAKYAVVEAIISDSGDAGIGMLFHLVDTNEGWKICLVGMGPIH